MVVQGSMRSGVGELAAAVERARRVGRSCVAAQASAFNDQHTSTRGGTVENAAAGRRVGWRR